MRDHALRGQRRDSARRRAFAVADLAALVIAYALASVLVGDAAAWEASQLALLIALPLWVLINKLLGLYDRDDNLVHTSTLDELPKLVQSVTYGTAGAFVVAPALLPIDLTRGGTIAFWALALAFTAVLRSLVRLVGRKRLAPQRCLIVGSGRITELVGHKIASHPEYGVQVVAVVDMEPEDDAGLESLPLRHVEWFDQICAEQEVERVVIAFSELPAEELNAVIRKSKDLELKVTVVPRLCETIGGSVEVDQVEGFTLLGLRGFSRTRSSLKLKRALDVAVASLGLAVFGPLLLGIAVGIRLSSPGPVLYRQRRIGRDNEPFGLFKFRTMVQDAEQLKPHLAHLNEADGPMFKIADDPRITQFGRRLRRRSLDELPQLWNVLRGEMSLVGPRPLVPDEDGQVIGWHRERLQLTPGLTGPWQVLGGTAIPFDEMVRLDYFYVAEWSLWNDAKLLLRTAPVVLFGRGQ